MRAIIVAVALALATGARAAEPTLAVGTNDNGAALGLDPETLREGMTAAIDAALLVGDQQPFLQAMARSTAVAAGGMGVDHVTTPKAIVIGGSFGTALALADAGGDSVLPPAGVSTHAAGMIGVPLSVFAGDDSVASRFTVYAHGGGLKLPALESFDASAATAGAHVQVALVKPASAGPTSWRGLALTTGVVWARYALSLTDKLAIKAPYPPVEVVWRTSGGYTVQASHLAMPLELSTAAHASVFGVFAGAGVDLNLASGARSDAGLSGNLVATVDGQPGETHVGEAVLGLDDAVRSPVGGARVFLGPDLAFGPLHVYAQLNVGLPDALAVHGGARLAL